MDIRLILGGKTLGTPQNLRINKTEKAARAVRHVKTERGVAPWSKEIFARVELVAKLTATKIINTTPERLLEERKLKYI